MTGREVITMALDQKLPPRNPVTLIAGGEWYFDHAGAIFGRVKTDPEAMAEVYVKAFQTIGHDMIWPGAGLLNYPAHCLGCPIKDDSTNSPALEGTAIKDLGELDKLSPEGALANPIMEAIVKAHYILADRIGEETFIMPTQWGPFTTAARILGVEKLMMATITDPDGVAALMDFTKEYIWSITQRVTDHKDLPGINFSEPVASGDLISKPMFEKFVQPVLADLVSRLKDAGKYSMIHICGNSTPVLDNILEVGPDGYSLESKVDLRVAKEKLGGKICVAGNIPPSGEFFTGTPDEVRAQARACLDIWGQDPGFILTVGCDFPKGVPLENIRALMAFKEVR